MTWAEQTALNLIKKRCLQMKQQFKKMLSMFVALSLTFGLLPLGSFATGGNSDGQIEKTDSKEIVYYTVDAGGNLIDRGTNNVVNNDTDKVSISQTISGTNKENRFDLNFTVKTTDQVSKTVVTSDAAVALIIDNSASMDVCVVCGLEKVPTLTAGLNGAKVLSVHESVGKTLYYLGSSGFYHEFTEKPNDHNKLCLCGVPMVATSPMFPNEHKTIESHKFLSCLDQAKATTKNFVTNYAKDAGGAKRLISLVSFSNSIDPLVDWVDVATEAGLNEVLNKIDGIQPQTDTCTAKAMDWAVQQFKKGKISAITNKSTILLTDGLPSDNKSDTENYAKTMKDDGTSVYSAYFGLEGHEAGVEWLTLFSTKAYSAKDSDALNDAFDGILHEITTKTKAGKVTIPLGQFITAPGIPADSTAELYYDGATRTITWNLGLAKAKVEEDPTTNETTYTYTTKIGVTLDTAADGFVEATAENPAYQPTNLQTTLSYSTQTTQNRQGDAQAVSLKTLNFRVPKVNGVKPEVEYVAKHWQERVDGKTGDKDQVFDGKTYTLKESDQPKKDKLGESVTLTAKEYANYTPVTAEKTVVLGAQDNVINFLYNRDTATVTVNHYLTTTAYSDPNEPPVITEKMELAGSGQVEGTFYVGDSYTAEKLEKLPYGAKWVSTTPNGGKLDKLVKGNNTIEFFYERELHDYRKAYATVHYYFYENNWELKDGKYTQVTTDAKENADLKVEHIGVNGKSYTAPELKDLGTGYVLDTEKTGSMTVTLSANAPATINVYYVKTGEAPAAAQLEVIHQYVTLSESGVILNTEIDKKAISPAYVGETHTIKPEETFGDNSDWECTTVEKDRTKVLQAGENTIQLNYTRTDKNAKTEVTVNHIFTKWVWKLVDITEKVTKEVPVEVTEPVEGVEGTDTETPVETTKTVTETVVVGQKWELVETTPTPEVRTEKVAYATGTYTAAPLTVEDLTKLNLADLACLTSPEDRTITLQKTGNVVNIYYANNPGEPGEAGEIAIQHEYNTYTTYINADGKLVQNELTTDTWNDETFKGIAGESMVIEPKTEYNNNTYQRTTSDAALKITIGTSANPYVVTYERHVNDLTDVTVDVKPVYVTYTRSIVNGKVETVRTEVAGDATISVPGTFYKGQLFPITDAVAKLGAKPGFAHDRDETISGNQATNPSFDYNDIRLTDDANTVVLYYITAADNLGSKQPITVNHKYTYTVQEIVNGKLVETTKPVIEDVQKLGSLYAGQFFTPTAQESYQGTTYTLTNGDVVKQYTVGANGLEITLEYKHVEDKTQSATLTVTHNYKTVDWAGNIIEETQDVEKISENNKLFVGQVYAISLQLQNGVYAETDVTSKTHNDVDMDTMTIALAAENQVVINYVKTVDNREDTKVTVKHNYFVFDKYTKEEKADGAQTMEFTGFDKDVWVNAPYQATLILESDLVLGRAANTYKFASALTGETPLLPDEKNPSLLQAVTLAADGQTVIEIKYVREVDSTPGTPTDPDPTPDPTPNPTPTPDPTPVTNYTISISYQDADTGSTLAPDYNSGAIRAGNDYDVSAEANRTISGYTIANIDGAVSGTLNSDVSITVSYTADQDIMDPDTPLGNLPDFGDDGVTLPPDEETIIIDPDVPLGNLPNTGTHQQSNRFATGFGLLLAAMGTGLLSRSSKKEDQ